MAMSTRWAMLDDSTRAGSGGGRLLRAGGDTAWNAALDGRLEALVGGAVRPPGFAELGSQAQAGVERGERALGAPGRCRAPGGRRSSRSGRPSRSTPSNSAAPSTRAPASSSPNTRHRRRALPRAALPGEGRRLLPAGCGGRKIAQYFAALRIPDAQPGIEQPLAVHRHLPASSCGSAI